MDVQTNEVSEIETTIKSVLVFNRALSVDGGLPSLVFGSGSNSVVTMSVVSTVAIEEVSPTLSASQPVSTGPARARKIFTWNARGLGSSRAFNILRSHK